MDCTYSAPVDYTGTTPVSGAQYWNFSKEHCDITPIPTSTPSAQTVASPAAYIDVASNSAIAKGVYDITFIIWMVGIIIAIACGFWFGIWMYKR